MRFTLIDELKSLGAAVLVLLAFSVGIFNYMSKSIETYDAGTAPAVTSGDTNWQPRSAGLPRLKSQSRNFEPPTRRSLQSFAVVVWASTHSPICSYRLSC